MNAKSNEESAEQIKDLDTKFSGFLFDQKIEQLEREYEEGKLGESDSDYNGEGLDANSIDDSS